MRTVYRSPRPHPLSLAALGWSLVVLAVALWLLLAATGRVHGAEPDTERDRKARAALALAGASAKPPVAVAPAPRLAAARDYATASRTATEQSRPLVVFVACKSDHAPAGAVTARAEALPGVTGPAAVVLYPSGGELFRHAVLKCPVADDDLSTAVRAAAKKVDAPKTSDAPAPKPLNWDVSADLPSPQKGEGCDCGDACPCGKKVAKAADPRDSIARVRRDLGDRYAQGSGTVVHSGQGWSIVLTAYHVTDGPGALTVRTGGRTLPAVLVDGDKGADLAALLIPGDFPAAKLSERDARDGDVVTVYGLTSVYSAGTVNGRETLSGTENLTYATAADSEGGDSGAGVFREGELVAVHLGKVSDKPRAAATGPVRKFLQRVLSSDRKTVPTELPKAAPKPEPKSAPPALPAGAIRTTSGKVLIPNGDGTYRYADGCAGGKCPLPR